MTSGGPRPSQFGFVQTTISRLGNLLCLVGDQIQKSCPLCAVGDGDHDSLDDRDGFQDDQYVTNVVQVTPTLTPPKREEQKNEKRRGGGKGRDRTVKENRYQGDLGEKGIRNEELRKMHKSDNRTGNWNLDRRLDPGCDDDSNEGLGDVVERRRRNRSSDRKHSLDRTHDDRDDRKKRADRYDFRGDGSKRAYDVRDKRRGGADRYNVRGERNSEDRYADRDDERRRAAKQHDNRDHERKKYLHDDRDDKRRRADQHDGRGDRRRRGSKAYREDRKPSLQRSGTSKGNTSKTHGSEGDHTWFDMFNLKWRDRDSEDVSVSDRHSSFSSGTKTTKSDSSCSDSHHSYASM